MEDLYGEVLGIMGGLGPLASAEFVRTVYRCASWEREQDAPRLVLDSNPAFPDRTTAFLAGNEEAVLEPLVGGLRRLVEFGATRLVICCMTAHHLVPRLPAELRDCVVPVPRVIAGQLRRATGRYLLLCTHATRDLRLLEREPHWAEVAARVVLPDPADQDVVHNDVIYQIKRGVEPASLVHLVNALVQKYGVDGFIVGCSELHLLANHPSFASAKDQRCIDPFLAIAASLAGPGASPGIRRSPPAPDGEAATTWRPPPRAAFASSS